MSTKVVRQPRGTTQESDSYTGPSGQITVDADRLELRLHDGATPGGIRILGLDQLLTIFRASADDPLGEDLPEAGLGFIVRIADGAYTVRDVTGSPGITITNPAGTGGNVNVAIDFADNDDMDDGDSEELSINPLELEYRLGTYKVAYIDPLKVEFWSVVLETPEDGSYDIVLKIPYAVTVQAITTKCVSGTCTLTGKIDGVALGGTANAVSSVEQSQAHVGTNTMAVDTDFRFTVSANAACTRLTATVKVLRT